MIPISKDILWDYKTPPRDLLWKLQRIADFFPLYGRERKTVEALYQRRTALHVDTITRQLIEEYYQAWQARKK